MTTLYDFTLNEYECMKHNLTAGERLKTARVT